MPNPEAIPYPVRGMDRGGVIKTYAPDQIPDYSFQDLINVKFKDGKASASAGWIAFASALDSRIMHSDEFFKRDGSEFLLVASLTQLYQYQSGVGPFVSIQDGSNFTVDDDQFFDTETGFDTFFITDGIDPVRQWTGTGLISVLPGLASVQGGYVNVVGSIIRSFSGFMVLLSTTESGNPYPQRVRWCVFGQPSNWTNDINGNGQAGWNDLADDVGFILWATAFNNYLCIYKERSIYLMQYVGPPTIFSFQRVINGVGLLAQRAVADLGDEHAFLGSDNFYTFNGISIEPIGTPIKDFFFADLDPGFRNRVQAFVVEEDDEVWWIYSSGATTYADGTAKVEGDPDRAVVWNYLNNTWSIRDNPGTYWFYYHQVTQNTWQTIPDLSWAATSGFWNDKRFLSNYPLNIGGMMDGSMVQYGGVFDKLGVPYTKSLQTKFFDFGKPGVKKRLSYIDIQCATGYAGTLMCQIGHCQNIGDVVQWETAQVIPTANGNNAWVNGQDITDVYFTFKFSIADASGNFDFFGYTPYLHLKTSQ
jgi:hypothetical protein